MIWHGLILNLIEINCWKVDEKKQRKTWHLEFTKTLPSVGVPSMPLLEKVN